MTGSSFLRFHLIATRKLLGLTQIEMALKLDLSPLEVMLAEGEGAKDPGSLLRPLPGQVELRLKAFLRDHPVARDLRADGLLGSARQSELA